MTITSASSGIWATAYHSIDTVTNGWVSWNNVPTVGTVWATANRAIYLPLRVPERCVVRKLGCGSSTVGAGNIDIGLYDAGGSRLVSAGSTAKITTTDQQVIDVTDTTIGPGLYYLALNNSTTTDTFTAASYTAPLAASYGILTEALGAVTLPATATWAVSQTLDFIPSVSALLVTEVA